MGRNPDTALCVPPLPIRLCRSNYDQSIFRSLARRTFCDVIAD